MTAHKHQTASAQFELGDFLFTEEDILKNVDVRDHIFEIKKNTISLGFVSLYDLKNVMAHNEASLNETIIRPLETKDWTPIFEHPYFQRRKPQLLSTQSSEDGGEQTFYVLKQGQKTGPFEKKRIATMLERKELLLTDLVSVNAGHTWGKLYQVEGFDRRTLKNSDQLPGLPFDGVFEKIEPTGTPDAETDALSGLAYLGNVKRGKVIEREKNANFDEEMTKKAGTTSAYKWLLVLSVIGIGYFLYNIKKELISPFAPAQNPIGEQAEMLTPVSTTETTVGERPTPNRPVNQFNDSRRSGKFETRNFQPIRPNQRKSFMETGKYQQINRQNDAQEEDQNYFYDNATPMELDPVRSQVSKENYEGPIGEPAAGDSGDPIFDEEVIR